jgi:hypothetical protein
MSHGKETTMQSDKMKRVLQIETAISAALFAICITINTQILPPTRDAPLVVKLLAILVFPLFVVIALEVLHQMKRIATQSYHLFLPVASWILLAFALSHSISKKDVTNDYCLMVLMLFVAAGIWRSISLIRRFMSIKE